MGIIVNEIVDQLANDEAFLDKPTNTPRIHTAHTTPTWLQGVSTGTTRALYATYKHILTKNTRTKN